MESLLRWGIANSTPQDGSQPPPQPRTDLDPGVIDAILGKSDAELMKEALTVAVDENRDEDERIQALDDFEMLVEQIDNANNLEKMKMWEPLHALLVNPTSSEGIQMQTLWILGTAVQNNPSAQNSYVALSPLGALLSFLSPTVRSGKTRSRAVYALSGLLKHNAAAVAQMADLHGWDVLRDALQDSDITVRRKVAFLLSTLLIPTEPLSPSSVPAPAPPANIQQPLQVPTSADALAAAATQPSASQLHALTFHPSEPSPETARPETSQPIHPNSHASMLADPSSYATSHATAAALAPSGIVRTLVAGLVTPVPHGPDGESEGDADFEEKALRTLHTYAVACRRPLEDDERRALGGWLGEQSAKAGGDAQVAERWGFTREEVRELKEAAT